MRVIVPIERSGEMEGLLGNYDGRSGNDLRTRDGQVLYDPSPYELHTDFANSWRISQTESLFDYASGTNTATYTDLAEPRAYLSERDLNAVTRNNAETTCLSAGATDPRVLAACIMDVGLQVTLFGLFQRYRMTPTQRVSRSIPLLWC